MMYGIIDIGSNTIRLAIYEIQDETLELLLKKKFMTGLASYIEDSLMTERGIREACNAILDFKRLLDIFGIHRVYAFATAALRNVGNSVQAVHEIESRTGISIDLISGEQEAYLDFAGATREMPIADGILIDIGGGSTELVIYEGQRILKMASLPVGSLNLYKACVANLFPTPDEKKKISAAVIDELEGADLSLFGSQTNICGIGGTLRATGKLHNVIYRLPEAHTEITAQAVREIYASLTEGAHADGMPMTKNLDLMLKTVPDRVRTILPGMIILETLTNYFSSERVKISSSGVREGYIYERILKKSCDMDA